MTGRVIEVIKPGFADFNAATAFDRLILAFSLDKIPPSMSKSRTLTRYISITLWYFFVNREISVVTTANSCPY